MRNKSNLAFIVELFIMFIILITVIVVITSLSMKTRQQSIDAGYLTEAVICAENAAEVTADAGSAKGAADLVGMMDEAGDVKVSGDTVTADIGFESEDHGQNDYTVVMTVDSEKNGTGRYVKKKIDVYHKGESSGDPIYTLDTGDFVKGGTQ